VRKATPKDLPEVERMLAEAAARGSDQRLPVRQVGRHHLLVLDAPDGSGLAAAAMLVISGTRGQLAMLVVDRRYRHTDAEARMMRVVENLCRVYGARIATFGSRAA
jgi:N-acetylglutamate synthase-like GNAT family acetyltransferase